VSFFVDHGDVKKDESGRGLKGRDGWFLLSLGLRDAEKYKKEEECGFA
jgi:hypothetical protein